MSDKTSWYQGLLSPKLDKHFNQLSTIVAEDDSGGIDGAKQLELGGTGGRAKGLGLGKAGDGLEEVDGVGRLELGRLGLGGAGDGEAGGGGADDDGRCSGGVVNGGADSGGAGSGGGGDGKRDNIGVPEESSSSGLMWTSALASSSTVNSWLDTGKSLACN